MKLPIASSKPFKLSMLEPKERDVHVACKDLLNLCLAPPAVWAAYPAGVTQLSPAQFSQYARFGIARGWPDLMICFGKMYGIELKRRGGRLTKTRVGRTVRGSPRELIGQEEVHAKLLASGAWGAIEIAHSIDEVCALLDAWQIPRIGGHSWLAVVQPTRSAPLQDVTSAKLVGGDSA